MIPVTKPYIPNFEKYSKYIQRVNDSGWLTNFGPLHQELTARLEDYLGVKNLLLVNNGTIALQIAFKALNLNQKVLTTPFSFIATTSSLVWENLAPDFVDIDSKSFCLDPKLLPSKPSSSTSAVLGVHVYGNPTGSEELDSYCISHNLKMIYDGAHAFGISKNGKSILTSGDATTLSLHATKVFHTVEGGAIIFKRRSDFEVAKQIINFGFDDQKEVVRLGINAKLSEYHAAAGLVLLDEVDSILERRVKILDQYHSHLKELVQFPLWDKDASQNGAYAPILLSSESEVLTLIQKLHQEKVQTRRYFHPSLNEISISEKTAKCPISEDISRRVLCLPIFTSMSSDEVNHVITSCKRALMEIRK